MYFDEDGMVQYVFRYGFFKIIYIFEKVGMVWFCLCIDELFKICNCFDYVGMV